MELTDLLGWLSTAAVAVGWVIREALSVLRGRRKLEAETEEIQVRSVKAAVAIWKELVVELEARLKDMSAALKEEQDRGKELEEIIAKLENRIAELEKKTGCVELPRLVKP